MERKFAIRSSRRWARVGLSGIAALALSAVGADLAGAQDASDSVVLAPPAQFAPTDQPSIVVTGSGEASAPAETAHLQLIVSRGYGPMMEGSVAVSSGSVVVEHGTPVAGEGPPQVEPAEAPPPAEPGTIEQGTVEMASLPRLTADDLAPIVDALVAVQVERDAIEVFVASTGAEFGPDGGGVGRIDATIEGPNREAVEAILDAVDRATTDAGLALHNVGIEYLIAECSPLLREARGDAIANARDQAAEMADLLGVALGEMLQAYDYGAAFGPGPVLDDRGCSSDSDNYGSGSIGFGPGLEVTIPAYDPAIPIEANVYAAITMTFVIGDTAP